MILGAKMTHPPRCLDFAEVFCPDQHIPSRWTRCWTSWRRRSKWNVVFQMCPPEAERQRQLEVAETFIPFWKIKITTWMVSLWDILFFLWPFKWSPFFVAKVKSPVGDFVAPTSLRLSPTILWSKPLPSEPTTPLPVRRSAECAVGPGYASTPASGQVLDRMKQRKVYPNPITFNTAMNSEFWWCFLQISLGIWFIWICFYIIVFDLHWRRHLWD